jgi:hypothetical protein
VAKLSFRQARLAQAVEQMLGILGALVERQPPLRAVDRVLRVEPQDLGRFRIRPSSFPSCARLAASQMWLWLTFGARDANSRNGGSACECSFSI